MHIHVHVHAAQIQFEGTLAQRYSYLWYRKYDQVSRVRTCGGKESLLMRHQRQNGGARFFRVA